MRARAGPCERGHDEEGPVPAISLPKATRRWQPPAIAAAVLGMLLATGWMAWSVWRSADLWARAQAAAAQADWDRAGNLLDRLSWYKPDDRNVLHLQVQAALGRGEPAV